MKTTHRIATVLLLLLSFVPFALSAHASEACRSSSQPDADMQTAMALNAGSMLDYSSTDYLPICGELTEPTGAEICALERPGKFARFTFSDNVLQNDPEIAMALGAGSLYDHVSAVNIGSCDEPDGA